MAEQLYSNHNDHYRMFQQVMWSDKFTGTKMRVIRRKVRQLCIYMFGLDFETAKGPEKVRMLNRTKTRMVTELAFDYFSKGHHLKYDSRYSLSTWIVQYIYLNINNLLRRYRPRAVEDGIDGRSDIFDDSNKNFLVEYEDYLDEANMDANLFDPEAILVGKELLGMMLGYFGEADTQVMLGLEDRLLVAERQGITYDGYNKRLRNRKQGFRVILARTGYIN